MFEAALAHFQQGRLREAVASCRRILERAPDDPHALLLSGAALEALGEHGAAVDAFRRLTELEPRTSRHWENLGTSLRSSGLYDDALAAYEQAARLGESSPRFLLNVALLRIDRLEYGRARALLETVQAAAPDDPRVRVLAAVAAFEQADDASARDALAGLDRAVPSDPTLLARAATILMQIGGHDEAEAMLRARLAEAPGDRACAVRLAQVLERTNRVEEAQSVLDAIARSPPPTGELAEDLGSIGARLHERRGEWALAVEGYRVLLAASRAPHLEHHVRFPLGRAFDAMGDVDAAFAEFERAHAAQMQFLSRSAGHILQPDRRAFSIAARGTVASDVARWNDDEAPSAAQSPIFVVGFPRSGTTLLEQTLDAHPQLAALDEQPFLQNAIDVLRASGVTYPDALARATPAHLDAARARYFERVHDVIDWGPGRRIVDKNPLNLLRLPGLVRLFPRARIVLAIRHPCDVILSCHQQHFRAPEFATLCRDLETLAHAYVSAFDFWTAEAAKVSPAVFELRYESLVQDFEGQARAMAVFLGLDWHDAMLNPALHARARGYISTPSYAQVTQPVTTKAIGRWQRYRRHFEPILPILRPYLDRWDYTI